MSVEEAQWGNGKAAQYRVWRPGRVESVSNESGEAVSLQYSQ